MARETRAIWTKRVDDWRASGLTTTEFAKKVGVARKTLRWWVWRLSNDSRAAKTPRTELAKRPAVKALKAIEATPLTFIEMSATPAIEVVLLNGIVVRIAPHFDPACLARALDVLERRR